MRLLYHRRQAHWTSDTDMRQIKCWLLIHNVSTADISRHIGIFCAQGGITVIWWHTRICVAGKRGKAAFCGFSQSTQGCGLPLLHSLLLLIRFWRRLGTYKYVGCVSMYAYLKVAWFITADVIRGRKPSIYLNLLWYPLKILQYGESLFARQLHSTEITN